MGFQNHIFMVVEGLSLMLEATDWSGGATGKEPACQCSRHVRDIGSLGREDPLEEGMATHSSILPGEPQGQKSLAGYSPWSHKESDTTEQLSTAQHSRVATATEDTSRW